MSTAYREPDRRYTYADYLTWPEWPAGPRVELIEGEVFDMSPSPSVIHQRLSRRLQYQIESSLREAGGPCELFHAPLDVLLPRNDDAPNDEIDTVVQPDLFVVCDAAKTRGRACRGAPDWIIEFLSPSNALHDLNRKYDLSERAGVREYWVVDPANGSSYFSSWGDGR